jgi:hypothetical protein
VATDTQLKSELVAYLEQLGFSAECIEESASPTPDLRALDSEGCSYVIEVKTRTTAWSDRAELLAEDASGRVLKRNDQSTASSSVAGDLEQAARQLDAGSREADLRLVWVLAERSDQQFLYEEVRRTAYGVKLAIATLRGQHATREAYFATYAAFARHRESIDGVLLGPFHALFLNSLSSRCSALKASRVARLCREAVLDPIDLDRKGDCYLVPVTDEPPKPASVMQRISSAYAVQVLALDDFTRFSAVVEIPKE